MSIRHLLVVPVFASLLGTVIASSAHAAIVTAYFPGIDDAAIGMTVSGATSHTQPISDRESSEQKTRLVDGLLPAGPTSTTTAPATGNSAPTSQLAALGSISDFTFDHGFATRLLMKSALILPDPPPPGLFRPPRHLVNRRCSRFCFSMVHLL